MADLPEKTQEEILKEFNRMLDRAKSNRDSMPDNSPLKTYDKGRVDGLRGAIMVIESWNEPNHGKVVARPA